MCTSENIKGHNGGRRRGRMDRRCSICLRPVSGRQRVNAYARQKGLVDAAASRSTGLSRTLTSPHPRQSNLRLVLSATRRTYSDQRKENSDPDMSRSVFLVPPLFEQRASEEFKKSGRTLSLAVSPRDNSLSVYATPNVRTSSVFASRF